MNANDSDDLKLENLDQLVPAPPPVLAGREDALERLDDGLREVSVAVVYGLAGVGKTAFVSAHAAKFQGRVIVTRTAKPSLSAVVDDARRQLADDGSIAELKTDAARVRMLARALDEQEALWFCDDIHELEPSSRQQLVESLALLLRKGRVIATSRQRVPVRPGAPLRLELFLDPLSEASSRTMWVMLDRLYGNVDGFKHAFQRCDGFPLALRQAHAGGAAVAEGGDPISATLAALTEDERVMALALALARVGLPSGSVKDVLPGGRGRDALRGLHRRLVLEVDGSGSCSIHAIFRERLLATAGAEQERKMHVELAEMLSSAPLPAVIRCREVVHHWTQAGRPENARDYLVARAGDMVRHGAAAELLTELDRLPPELLTADVELLRGRCLLRISEIERGYHLLVRAVNEKPNPRASDHLALAQAALLFGQLATADRALQDVVVCGDLSRKNQMRHAVILGSLRVIQQRNGEARELAVAAQRTAKTPESAGWLEALIAFSYYAERRYADAEACVRRMKRLQASSPKRTTSRMFITPAVVYVNLGLFEDAQQTLREAGAGLEEDDELVPVALLAERAILSSAQGDVLQAAQMLGNAVGLYHRIGLLLGAWWASTQLGRNLLLLGRVREGLRVLDDAEREALYAGARVIATSARAERAWEPTALLDDLSFIQDLPFPRAQLRTTAVKSLQASIRGEGASALRESAAERRRIEGLPSHGLDRAFFYLAEAVAGRLQGCVSSFTQGVARAREATDGDGADGDLVDRLIDKLGRVVVVRGDGTRCLSSDAQGVSSEATVVDARESVLRAPSVTIDLGKRAVLRKMLYLLSANPGERVANEQIVRRVWDVAYDPRVHENVLHVNVRRLRKLLEPTPLRISAEDMGYRLAVPDEFLFVEPL